MLTPRQAQLAFVPLVALSMSGFISLALTVLNLGLTARVWPTWLQQWPVAFAVALPVALLVVPSVRALLARLTRAPASTAAGGVGDLG